MSLLNSAAAKLSAYNRDNVLSASPARLLTMLYDRLVLDLTRAEEALLAQNWPTAWENLRHADQIVAELASSLKVDLWDGAEGLLQLYSYLAELIVAGTVDHDAAKVHEAIELVEPLRLAWHEAAESLPASSPGFRSAAGPSPYGASVDGESETGRDLGVA